MKITICGRFKYNEGPAIELPGTLEGSGNGEFSVCSVISLEMALGRITICERFQDNKGSAIELPGPLEESENRKFFH